MQKHKRISLNQAKRVGECLHIDWEQVDLEEFRQDLMGKPKAGAVDPETGLSYDSVLLTGKVVLAHMDEIPDYATRLAKLRAEVDEYRSGRR
jgi:pyrimidine operon attenuation protein/uracil phosphoribosyltransferase